MMGRNVPPFIRKVYHQPLASTPIAQQKIYQSHTGFIEIPAMDKSKTQLECALIRATPAVGTGFSKVEHVFLPNLFGCVMLYLSRT